ncbi:putative pex2 pex12 amino terminal region protein [Cladorrhinum samala]|uniref:Peroxisome assembly protein 12 n=1 Tax=Cladorrhinum samala TaxID=585594 RepID=A0AAV9HBP2_9PEZI|nr:putative pex2 pex12 amino terminal region protein [Cladorrhinum samala]
MEFVTALRGSFDPAKPSLFELLSEQQLSSLLPPTIRYLLTLLTHRYPRYLLRALNSFDELYALLSLVIERHYLITRGGSFTEHFYGLKREKSLAAEIPRASASAPGVVRSTLALTHRSDIYKNLLVLVGIPYLKRKLDEAHEVDAPRALLGASYNQLPPNPTFRQKLAHYWRVYFLRRIYPYVNFGYYLSLLAFNLGYLFDNTKYHDPFLWLINTRIRRMGGADYQALEALSKSPAGQRRTILSRMLGSLSLVLPTSIFALKFLEWWYASDFAKQLTAKAAESLELPPPVVPSAASSKPKSTPQRKDEKEGAGEGQEKEEKTKEEQEAELVAAAPISATSLLPIFTVPAPADSELCPICEGEIVTPTACQTGIVYCYTCIHKWLTGTHARQEEFMKERGGTGEEEGDQEKKIKKTWESGEGRCAVTARKVLAGTEGLRRVMV